MIARIQPHAIKVNIQRPRHSILINPTLKHILQCIRSIMPCQIALHLFPENPSYPVACALLFRPSPHHIIHI
jgi:hypothetical protein